jgi:outer membrane protein TolC
MSQYQGGGGYTNFTSIGLSLSIFDGFRDYSAYKVQYETYAAADLRHRQLMIDSESQWKAAKERFAIALNTALAREKTLAISRRIYDANEQRFRMGRASANDLAVDHTRLVESQLLAIQGWSAVHVGFSQLCHALGRTVVRCENF